MTTDSKAGLASVILEVLEQHAFLFAEPVTAGQLPRDLAEGVVVSLDFEGPTSGRIEIGCPRELSRELATNVLALPGPDAVAVEDAEDALKELLNVLAGHVLTHVDAGSLFDLAPPVLAPDEDGSRWKHLLEAEDSIALRVEDHVTLVHLTRR